jgi:predicted transcriptional regulator
MTPRSQADTPDRVMMLSIHPRHVEKILDSSKTVELRRTRPAVSPGQPVAISGTVPSAALVATCRSLKSKPGARRRSERPSLSQPR